MTKSKRRLLTAELKADVDKLVRAGGQSIAQVARILDLAETALREWDRLADIEAGEGPPCALTQTEREELFRLRRENKRLQMERDILKKRRPSSRRRASEVSVQTRGAGQISIDCPLSAPGGFQERLLCVREEEAFEACERGADIDDSDPGGPP